MEKTSRSDAVLIARAKGGDLDAFAELVRTHEHRVRAVLYRLLDDERDVEETTQDSFVQAWRNLDRFRGDSAVFTWLYRIAVNEALARLRRKHVPLADLTDVERIESRVAEAAGDPGRAAETGELRAFLAGRIRSLPFEHRAPLVLRDLAGLSNQEVADVLDISLSAAKSRVHRARMQVREEFERWERLSGYVDDPE